MNTIQATTRYIGECVCCGATKDPADEHIVPRGLSGPWQLLKGSCQSCNRVTSTFEKRVLREERRLKLESPR